MTAGSTSRRPVRLEPLRRFVAGHRRLVTIGLPTLVCAGLAVLELAGIVPGGHDAYVYWQTEPADPYRQWLISTDGFKYTPAFAQAMFPLHELPWPVFLVLWAALLGAALGWLFGALGLVALLLPPILLEVLLGNIHLFLAVTLAVGLGWPAVWPFVLLSKPTLGVVLLWFVIRREWRALAVALGATAAIMAVSALIAPDQWATWLTLLSRHEDDSSLGLLPLPLVVRLPIAALLVAWAARSNRPWLLPAAAWIALPIAHWTGLALLLAVPRIRAWQLRSGGQGARPGPALLPA